MQDLLKTLPQYIIPKHALTVFAGLVANNKQPWIKNFIIQRFIKKYQVNMDEALIENPCAYDSFNDFFTRYLKPECRPREDADIISPVDGCVSEIGSIKKGQLIQAKGKYYSVEELLACNTVMAEKFSQGKFATLYLSPKDYHRVHMPIDATLISMTYVPGALFSVQPSTAKTIPRLFSRNERLVLFFETSIGLMAMVLVGATIVGAIGTSWHGDVKRSKTRVSFDYNNLLLKQSDELGYFKLGSTVILLFANGNNMQWNPMLGATDPIRFGQALGALAEI